MEYEGEYLFDKIRNGVKYDKDGNILYEINNGKGSIKKYYKNGKLKIEISYLNDLKNGKGKEYYENGAIKYEGEYINFKRWNGNGYNLSNNIVYELKEGKGFVKEYYSNGKLEFEGQYLNGEKNGKGKEYNKYGEIIFKERFLMEKKMGKEKNMMKIAN